MSQASQYEWDAAAYHQLSEPQVAWGERVLATLELRGDERVLDAGCGTGRLTATILRRLPHGEVIALDRSANMLQVARKTLQGDFGSRVRFLRADLQRLALDEPVDVIVSTATFHWVRDHPQLFHTLYKALKPGGRLLAQCGGHGNLARLMARVDSLLRHEPYAQSFVGWTSPWEFADAATTAARLASSGFVEVQSETVPASTVLPDAATFRSFVETVILRAHLSHLHHPTLAGRMLETLTRMAAQDTPPYLLDYVRLNMQAIKPAQEFGSGKIEPTKY